MQLRSNKIPRNKFESETSSDLFKRTKSRSIAPASEPIPVSNQIPEISQLIRTKSEVDIEDLRKQYANNPQALQALEDHFRDIKTSSETGILGSRTEEIIYSSFFFRKDILDNFTKNIMLQIPAEKKESHPLSSFKLYNADDILENIGQRGTFKTRFTEQSPEYQELRGHNMDKLINFLSSKICEDIGPSYAKTAVEKAISLKSKNIDFDIIVLSSKNIEAMGLTDDEEDEYHDTQQTQDSQQTQDTQDSQDTQSSQESNDSQSSQESNESAYFPKSSGEDSTDINDILTYRLSGVVGFIIVELGECKMFPYGYSINLICTNKKAPAGSGSILMGLYLYTILSHPDNIDKNPPQIPNGKGVLNIVETEEKFETTFNTNEPLTNVQHFGILELASAYANAGGLCMYEKFGFQYDESMYGPQCFEDFLNLPMIIDFKTKPGYMELTDEQKRQKVINISAGTDKGFPKSKICSVRDFDKTATGKLVETKNQTLLGYLKSLKILMDNDMSNVTGPYAQFIYKKLYYILKFINEPTSRIPYESRPEPKNPGNIDTYINYLENPGAQKLDLTPFLEFVTIKKSRGGTKRKRNFKNKQTKKIRKSKKTKKILKHGKRKTHKR